MSARIAVIGGGYAGFAAAVTLAEAGKQVTVFESASTLGGRARRVDFHSASVDNGAHILLGAYQHLLALLHRVHGQGAERELLLRRRLVVEQPGVFRLRAPTLPAPWHLVAALLTMRGVARGDRLASIAFARRVARSGFRCAADLSVDALLADQPPAVVRLLWEPLCLAALNTPIARASAQTFLNVLRYAFAHRRADCDLLLPRVDLSALFPEPAAGLVCHRGGEVRSGVAVTALTQRGDNIELTVGYATERFDAVVVAVGPHQLARLLGTLDDTADTVQRIAGFAFEPITTAYLRYPVALRAPLPMLKLDGAPGQWLFDREALDGTRGLAAVVISTELQGERLTHPALATAIDAQLRRVMPHLPEPESSQVIAERRATYACTPALSRPGPGMLLPRVALAGDYTDSELPATLEAAVRSGVIAARALLATPI
jgi:squalene-associated FAD-dependent desaturase